MLLSNNEYLTYKTSFWRRLRNSCIKEMKSARFIITAIITIALTIILKFQLLDEFCLEQVNKFYSFTSDQGLSLENIYLEGQINLKNDHLIQAVKSEVGTPILKVDVWDIKKRLEELDWVLVANVARELPGTLHIRIVERTPIAIWQNHQKQYLIDDEGHVIQDNDISKFIHLPVVVGDGSRQTASEIMEIIKKFPEINNRLSAVIRVGDRRWNLRLKRGPEIKLPENDVEQALKTVLEYDNKRKLLSYDIEVIDMRIKDKIYYKKRESIQE